MTSRVALVKQLAGLNWGECFDVFRIISTLSLVKSAEYFSSVWNQCSHAEKLNTLLIKPFIPSVDALSLHPLIFFPFLAGIES